MEVTLRDDYDGKYKGYPIFTERMRNNAEAYGNIKIDIPLVNTGFKIFGLDDRMNNKIFKICKNFEYNGKEYNISFDLYTDALMEILLIGKIENGVILSPITFIDGGKLVLEHGDLHDEYLKRQSKVLAKPLKEFKIGYEYKRQEDDYCSYIYYGKINGKHYFVKSSDYCTWLSDYNTVKSPTFRIEIGKSERDLDEHINKCYIKAKNCSIKSWAKDLQEILKIIDTIKEFRG